MESQDEHQNESSSQGAQGHGAGPEAPSGNSPPKDTDVGAEGHGNHDSTYGGSEGTGMSASLASTVFDYVYEASFFPFFVVDAHVR